jgi:hypothetical protein
MFGNKPNTAAKTKTGRFTKARKILLGVGGITLAGIMMGASPAMARDRDYRGDRFERHDRFEHREFRHDIVVGGYIDPVVVCDPVPAPVNQVWVPDQFEVVTHWHHGRPFAERVLVTPGHWVCQ